MTGNQQLGDFLRSRRARIDPDAAGLPSLRRRRTPGLRREEVAGLAGISSEWYVKLEQGRAVSPSPATVAALGQALRLDPTELAHLRALVERSGRPPFVRESVPASLRRLVKRLPEPAYVTGQRWDVLAWNDAAATLFGFPAWAPEDRNILLWMFADPEAERLFDTGWAREARRMVARFRPTHDLWAGDAAFADLVARLRAARPEFEPWWTSHEVAAPVAGTKVLHHPRLGRLEFDHAGFQANDDPALKLAIYTRR